VTQLTFASDQILSQLDALICGISDEDFAKPSTALGGSTIGQHIRHTLEFFACLERGFHDGIISYDRRAHDKALETDRSLAMNSIRGIQDFVRHKLNNRSLILEAGYLRDSDASCSIPTTCQRELAYTIEHAIHHMAIIKIGLREVAPYLSIVENFGVAASTSRHKEAVTSLR
jgi:uncharacterized damage-inducible protein DinB